MWLHRVRVTWPEFDLNSMLDAAAELDAMVMITRPLVAAVVENETIGWVSSRTGSQPQRYVAARSGRASRR